MSNQLSAFSNPSQPKEFHAIFFLFFMFVSETFAGICIIFQKTDKNKIEKITYYKKSIFFSVQNTKFNSKFRLFQFFLLLFCLDFGCFLIGKYNESVLFDANITPDIVHSKVAKDLFITDVFFLGGLSYFVLHYPMLRHRKISSVLLLIGACLVLIPYFTYQESRGTALYICLTVLSYIFFSVQKTLEKIAMKTKVILFNKICFYEGLVGVTMTVIISLLFYLIDYFVPSKTLQSIGTIKTIFIDLSYIFTNGFLLSIYFIIWIITSGFYNLFDRLVICNYTPMHSLIGDTFTSFFCCIYFIINYSDETKDKFYSLGGYIALIIGILIYCEILILNFCNLSYNTGNKISKRSESEYIRTTNSIEIKEFENESNSDMMHNLITV